MVPWLGLHAANAGRVGSLVRKLKPTCRVAWPKDNDNKALQVFPGASLVAQTVKNPSAMQETCVFDPWVGKIPWRREWLPTLAFWPGEFHGLYSSWGRQESTRLSDFHFQVFQGCKVGRRMALPKSIEKSDG